jgi:hypothetical protein
MDHLFVSEKDKKIVYAELKSNLNLDTEKTKATIRKCISNYECLKELYSDYTIEWCLLGLRFVKFDEIPTLTKKKYFEIQDNLFGIDDYLKRFEISSPFNGGNSEMDYFEFLNAIAEETFDLD